MRLLGSGLLVLLSLVAVASLAQGIDDDFHFLPHLHDGTVGEERTEVAYVGEEGLWPAITPGRDAMNLSYEVKESPLFNDWGAWEHIMPVEAGVEYVYNNYLQLNRDAPPGESVIRVDLEYNIDWNQSIRSSLNVTIDYLLAFTVEYADVPDPDANTVRVVLETHILLDRLSVIFQSEGTLDFDEERILRVNAPPGSYTFETDFTKIQDIEVGEDLIWIQVRGFTDGRLVDYLQDPIDVDPGVPVQNVVVFLMVIVVVVIFAVVFIMLRRTGRADDAE
jgi:hypothetical protein